MKLLLNHARLWRCLENMRLHSLDEVKDEIPGKRGSARREMHEKKVEEAVAGKWNCGEPTRA